jgi:beta-lactamase superfamily II metal-dependent hydrolase
VRPVPTRILEAVDPEAAIISVGDGNDYGHPHSEVIDRLLADDVEIYQTEQGWLDERFDDEVDVMNDSITISTDGENWSIE